MIDESSEFGARAARHLREETVVWLTTVTPSGAPLPSPVGFLWDGGDDVFVYSQPGARIRNISSNPKVTLNFRGDANGGDIVILSGAAEVDESRPSADRVEGSGYSASVTNARSLVRSSSPTMSTVCHAGSSTPVNDEQLASSI